MSTNAKEISKFVKNMESTLVFPFEFSVHPQYVMRLLQLIDSHEFKVTSDNSILKKLQA